MGTILVPVQCRFAWRFSTKPRKPPPSVAPRGRSRCPGSRTPQKRQIDVSQRAPEPRYFRNFWTDLGARHTREVGGSKPPVPIESPLMRPLAIKGQDAWEDFFD